MAGSPARLLVGHRTTGAPPGLRNLLEASRTSSDLDESNAHKWPGFWKVPGNCTATLGENKKHLNLTSCDFALSFFFVLAGTFDQGFILGFFHYLS
jgi:hypothetical protein